MAQHLLRIAALEKSLGIAWANIVPVSAVAGRSAGLLADDTLVGLLPEGPTLYPDGEITDEPEETLVAELIREAALEGVRDELPHSITVEVEEMGLREGRPADKPLLDVFASMIVERDSPEGHHHRPPRQPAARDRRRRPAADRGAARHPGLPGSEGQGAQGVAARHQAPEPAGFLALPHSPQYPVSLSQYPAICDGL